MFTAATVGYFAKVRTLAQTVKAHDRDVRFVLVLVDRTTLDLRAIEPTIDEVLSMDDLGIDGWPAWLFEHQLVEACTGVKGRAAATLLRRPCCRSVVYLDPDIAVFDSLAPVHEALEDAAVVITPHLLDPEISPSGVIDHEIGTLRYGTFNLGFIGIRAGADGERFVDWWSERLLRWCFDDIPNGLFTDQRWVDLAIGMFPFVQVLRHPGCNVATWNISRREVRTSGPGHYTVNGAPLVFFHFSGYDSGAQQTMLDRYADPLSAAFEIRRWYDEQLRRNELDVSDRTPWAFSTFDDGRPVLDEHRRTFRHRVDLHAAFPDPFSTAAPSFVEWFDAQHRPRGRGRPGPGVLHLMHYGGGGTDLHLASLVATTASRCRHLVLQPVYGNGLRLTDHDAGEVVTLGDGPEDVAAMVREARARGVGRIHLHHVLGLEAIVERVLADLAVPYDVTLHDYYFLAPDPNLTKAGRFVGEDLHDVDLVPYPGARRSVDSIGAWQEWTLPILDRAERVIAPSTDVADRYRRHVAIGTVLDRWHHEDPRPEQLPVTCPRPGRTIRVAALNAVNITKGSRVVTEVLTLARTSGIDLEVHLVGAAAEPGLRGACPGLVRHGAHPRADLQRILAGIRADLGWFPAQWPETYCYALSDVMAAGLPVLASDLGAFPERLAGREHSWVVPPGAAAEQWLDAIVRASREGGHGLPLPAHRPGGRVEGFYPDSYLDWVG